MHSKAGDKMKVYNKKKTRWYKKVRFIPTVIASSFLFLLLIFLFFCILSGNTNLIRSIITSVIITILLTFDIVYSQVLKYEEKIPVVKGQTLYLLIYQKITDFFDTDIKIDLKVDLNDENDVEKVIDKQDDYVGLSLFKVDKVRTGKHKNSYLLDGVIKEWSFKETKDTCEYILVEKNKCVKINIDDDYYEYKDLIEYLNNKE